MSSPPPTLHLLFGKPGSGKSTLAKQLSTADRTVLLSEDIWLHTLFGPEMTTLTDYATYSARLQQIIAPHVAALLGAGVSVVMDFQANTRATRDWMRGIIDQSGATHILHVLDVPDATCLARLRERNAAGAHPFALTEDQFHRVLRHIVPPSPDEGFTLRHHAPVSPA